MVRYLCRLLYGSVFVSCSVRFTICILLCTVQYMCRVAYGSVYVCTRVFTGRVGHWVRTRLFRNAKHYDNGANETKVLTMVSWLQQQLEEKK